MGFIVDNADVGVRVGLLDVGLDVGRMLEGLDVVGVETGGQLQQFLHRPLTKVPPGWMDVAHHSWPLLPSVMQLW